LYARPLPVHHEGNDLDPIPLLEREAPNELRRLAPGDEGLYANWRGNDEMRCAVCGHPQEDHGPGTPNHLHNFINSAHPPLRNLLELATELDLGADAYCGICCPKYAIIREAADRLRFLAVVETQLEKIKAILKRQETEGGYDEMSALDDIGRTVYE
jgi:hypothetical protein